MAREISPMQQVTDAKAASGEHGGRKIGAFLCWAVVFADIGTSVYYTPGILFKQFGALAGFFVILTLVAFVLLTLKYAEVSVRFPEGGGVVTVAARGLNPWAGAVGGMFILVDYFLTSAISSLSGLQYFQDVFPSIGPFVLLITLVVLVFLGILNWIGIKESAIFSAVIAVAALVSDVVILALIFIQVPLTEIGAIFTEMFGQAGGLIHTPFTLLAGFAGAFLAFSGLESISQLSPVMRTPRRKTVGIALALVAITVGITSPLLTVFSTILLDPQHQSLLAHPVHHLDPNQFISLLAGATYGGRALEVATAVTAAALLIFASNTAIIGAYHVFLALSRMNFLPQIVERIDTRWRQTPYVSIILATAIPIIVLIAASGQIDILGELYAFGLLGAFSLTCISLDVIRWRERHGAAHVGAIEARDDQHSLWSRTRYYLGFLTTALVVVAWVTNLYNKPLATAFGGGLTVLGLGVAVAHFQYKTRSTGVAPVYPMGILSRLANSILVVLPSLEDHNAEVIRAAVESAGTRRLVFLYLAEKEPVAQRAFEITDPYGNDQQAQDVFMQAARLANHAGVTANYIYRIGDLAQVPPVWRAIRPDEIVALASISKPIAKQIAPEYVRYQLAGGVRVAHYVLHPQTPGDERVAGGGAAAPSGGKGTPAETPKPPKTPAQHAQPSRQAQPATGASPAGAYRDLDLQTDGARTSNGNGSGGKGSDKGTISNGYHGGAGTIISRDNKAGALKNQWNGVTLNRPSTEEHEARSSQPTGQPDARPLSDAPSPQAPQPSASLTPGEASGRRPAASATWSSDDVSDDSDEWVWTGTELVERKDLPPETKADTNE